MDLALEHGRLFCLIPLVGGTVPENYSGTGMIISYRRFVPDYYAFAAKPEELNGITRMGHYLHGSVMQCPIFKLASLNSKTWRLHTPVIL